VIHDPVRHLLQALAAVRELLGLPLDGRSIPGVLMCQASSSPFATVQETRDVIRHSKQVAHSPTTPTVSLRRKIIFDFCHRTALFTFPGRSALLYPPLAYHAQVRQPAGLFRTIGLSPGVIGPPWGYHGHKTTSWNLCGLAGSSGY
jgi:hypothetical protein